MPTNKRNNEVGKSFDIGTKIEYDGKSYKVIESDSCGDCSIASICSSSDIFGEVVQCNDYVDKKDFYKHSSKRTGYIIPYNFPLNTRRGFRTIYFLMKLSQHDMTTVIKDIIAVRHAGIDFILNICDKLEKENDFMLTFLYGEARM